MTDKTTIRNLNPDLYIQARIAAVEHNCTVADIINDALEDWLGEAEVEEREALLPTINPPDLPSGLQRILLADARD